MLKAIFVGTTALTLLGSSLVYAQQTPSAQPAQSTTGAQPSANTGERHRMTAEERAAFTDARITELKTGLQLTAAQQKLWSTFETTLRDTAKQRSDRFKANQQSEAQRPDRNAAATPEEVAEQKKLATALDPLYKSLDDGQKQKFASMFRVDGEGRHFWFRGGRRS